LRRDKDRIYNKIVTGHQTTSPLLSVRFLQIYSQKIPISAHFDGSKFEENGGFGHYSKVENFSSSGEGEILEIEALASKSSIIYAIYEHNYW